MKKLLLLLFIGIVGIGNAQFLQDAAHEHVPAQKISLEKSSFSGWYNYGSEIYSLGGAVSYYRAPLFPDSTVLVEYSSGMGTVWHHSAGQVLDPVSEFHGFGNNIELNQDNYYTLDSVGFWYRYFRHQQGAPDTLIIQVYDNSKIYFSEDPWGNGKSYANVDYDYTVRKGADATTEIVYILDNDDEATVDAAFLQFPIGLSVAAGEKVAATITYIPGNSFNVNDTIDQYMVIPPTNLINAFYYFYYVDEDFVSDFGFYNNHILASTSIRYNSSTNGWNGSYIPGTSWNGGIYHANMYFHITSDNVGIEDESNDLRDAVLYPNPANERTMIKLNLQEQTDIRIELFDISGKTLIDLGTKRFYVGKSQISLNTENLAAGLYYCKITSAQHQSSLVLNKL